MSELAIDGSIPLVVQRDLRLISAHPSVTQVQASAVAGSNATIANINIRTELPSAWKIEGKSPSGVISVEPVQFLFSSNYPLLPPRVSLRADFNRSHPHIQPSNGGEPPEPCLVAGSAREVMRLRGIGGILEQLVDWLDKASVVQLINPHQGWEPTRRDSVDDVVVADASWLTSLPTRDGGCSAFLARYYSLEAGGGTHWIQLPANNPVPIGESIVSQWVYSRLGKSGVQGTTHAIVAWSGKLPSGSLFLASNYVPETVKTVGELIARAELLGCAEFLKPSLNLLQMRIAKYGSKRSQPIAVLLLARRPFKVIGTSSPIEICPYVIEIRGGDKFDTNSLIPVRIAMHRDEISKHLLQQAAGDDGGSVKPWTLFGCGSVGSKIAVHLARSGRGPSAVVDRSHLQPHNFARYATLPSDNPVEVLFGTPKADHLAESLAKLKCTPSVHYEDVVSHIVCGKPIVEIVAPQSFAIVNTTGSASVREALALSPIAANRPRLVEACLLGIGSVGLMSIEGQGANPSTMDHICEAYRIIHATPRLRAEVFNAEAEAVNIGQGCSTLTMPLSDSRLSAFAAPMAEQILHLQRNGMPDTGQLLIGSVDANGLNQCWTKTAVLPRILLGTSETGAVRLSPSVDEIIKREVKARKGSETGGILVGRYSDVTNTFFVVDVLPAPADSKFSASKFVLGREGLRPILTDLIEGSGGALYALGTWHNHLTSSGPSTIDHNTAALLCVQQYFPLLMLIYTPNGYLHLTAQALNDVQALPFTAPTTQERIN
jgi:hypothetical protein